MPADIRHARTPWSAAVDPLSLPHADAQRLLSTGAPVFLPVNPIEYHGPHLSLHNDALVTRGLVGLLHAAWSGDNDVPMLVTADLEVGVEPVRGPGTQDRPFAEVRDRVEAACTALADLGAQRVVVVTFHGAPMHSHALHAGVERLVERDIPAFAPMACMLREQIAFSDNDFDEIYALIEDADDRAALHAGMSHDFHGGFLETSLALALAPDGVSDVRHEVPDCPSFPPDAATLALARQAESRGRAELAQELKLAAWGKGWMAMDGFLGYSSKPRLASAEAGWMFANLLLPAIVEQGREVLWGGAAAPTPPMSWLRKLSLGGRLRLG
jgi:creatinine amidohydrolase